MESDTSVTRILGLTVGAFCAVAAGVIVIAAIVIGGWQANWWFTQQNINRTTTAIEHGQGYQTSKTDDLNQQIGNVLNTTVSMLGTSGSERAGLHAQRLGDARLACADVSQIVHVPADQAGWVKTNCLDGTLNPASPLLKN